MAEPPSNIIHADFRGHDIAFTGDGWFNATAVAAPYARQPYDWIRLPETQRYIDALRRNSKPGESRFVITKRGGAPGAAGTWMHPKLAVAFARWLDIDFGIWCDEQIMALLRAREVRDAEYLPTYHAMHNVIDIKAAASSNKKFAHMNANKLVNKTVGIGPGQRNVLPSIKLSVVAVAQVLTEQAYRSAVDHHDGYAHAKESLTKFSALLAGPHNDSPPTLPKAA